ncbi:MAG TPA: hypothetical protein VMT62_04785 [Syntrophorhabdaceae bacterium]|nr:hypothetical protein [Syntrophorhabdaceae bacterium]
MQSEPKRIIRKPPKHNEGQDGFLLGPHCIAAIRFNKGNGLKCP